MQWHESPNYELWRVLEFKEIKLAQTKRSQMTLKILDE